MKTLNAHIQLLKINTNHLYQSLEKNDVPVQSQEKFNEKLLSPKVIKEKIKNLNKRKTELEKNYPEKKQEQQKLNIMLVVLERIIEKGFDPEYSDHDFLNADMFGNLEINEEDDVWDEDILSEEEIELNGMTADKFSEILTYDDRMLLQKMSKDLDLFEKFKNKVESFPDAEKEIKQLEKNLAQLNQIKENVDKINDKPFAEIIELGESYIKNAADRKKLQNNYECFKEIIEKKRQPYKNLNYKSYAKNKENLFLKFEEKNPKEIEKYMELHFRYLADLDAEKASDDINNFELNNTLIANYNEAGYPIFSDYYERYNELEKPVTDLKKIYEEKYNNLPEQKNQTEICQDNNYNNEVLEEAINKNLKELDDKFQALANSPENKLLRQEIRDLENKINSAKKIVNDKYSNKKRIENKKRSSDKDNLPEKFSNDIKNTIDNFKNNNPELFKKYMRSNFMERKIDHTYGSDTWKQNYELEKNSEIKKLNNQINNPRSKERGFI